MTAILVVLEQRHGALRKGHAELLAAARRLADQGGGSVDALVCGAGAVAGIENLGSCGADRVLTATHAEFAQYCPDGITTTVAAIASSYRAILVAATATGKDLAPRLAARTNASCGTDVIAVDIAGAAVRVVRPIYAGKVLQTVDLAGTPVISVRPGSYAPMSAGRPGSISDVAVPTFTKRLEVKGVRAAETSALDVAEARVIVSGGRGLGEAKHFALLNELVQAFGGEAAVGASRAVVDAGWIGHSTQVGQTGKTVSPELYIAIGISGAIQHLAGMRTAKVIVAINRDKDAPIFKVADYGIVGDLFEIVPALTDAIRRAKAH